jgi:triosephosphate isomerase
MLNHVERPLSPVVLAQTIRRAEEVGLFSIVCASSITEIATVARLTPDIIVAEPTELIGTSLTSDLSYIHAAIRTVREVNPDILVLSAAGISSGSDVYRVILAGADATGSSSGIALASDPGAMAAEMIGSVRKAWDSRKAPASRHDYVLTH